MSHGPTISQKANTKRQKQGVAFKLLLALLMVLVAILAYSFYSSSRSNGPSETQSSNMQTKTLEEKRKSTEPALKDAAKELQTTDKSLQKDLDTTELDREIDSIVIE